MIIDFFGLVASSCCVLDGGQRRAAFSLPRWSSEIAFAVTLARNEPWLPRVLILLLSVRRVFCVTCIHRLRGFCGYSDAVRLKSYTFRLILLIVRHIRVWNSKSCPARGC